MVNQWLMFVHASPSTLKSQGVMNHSMPGIRQSWRPMVAPCGRRRIADALVLRSRAVRTAAAALRLLGGPSSCSWLVKVLGDSEWLILMVRFIVINNGD